MYGVGKLSLCKLNNKWRQQEEQQQVLGRGSSWQGCTGSTEVPLSPCCSLRDVRRKQCAEYTRAYGECRTTESQNCSGWKRPLGSVRPSVKNIKRNIDILKYEGVKSIKNTKIQSYKNIKNTKDRNSLS